MMRKFQWSLLKTLEFLRSRRADFKIRNAFLRQLCEYEERLLGQGLGAKTTKWNEVLNQTDFFDNEELTLRNTYLNAQKGPFADLTIRSKQVRSAKIKWIDHETLKAPLASVIGAKSSIKLNSEVNSKKLEVSNNSINPLYAEDKALVHPLKVKKFEAGIKKTKSAASDHKANALSKVKNNYTSSLSASRIPRLRAAKSKPTVTPPRKLKGTPKYERFLQVNQRNAKYRNSSKPLDGREELEDSLSRIRKLYEELDLLKGHKRKATPVARIINQNNVNNYIIQSSENVQLIGNLKTSKDPSLKKAAVKRPASAAMEREVVSRYFRQ
eukprot:TRINITY_DN12286_c0_g1_i11.p1 TRINITY_DN12286_c0_g1~~TRINITY_DN12286_c0_g1_i11.p1  ORF type:complete len:326 (-),score=36.40 TRINITY_DN12286_c0_g1_i11:442-1419(-)